MTENIPVVYANVFDYTTPEKLAAFISKDTEKSENTAEESERFESEELADVLKYNTASYVDEVSYSDIGKILVTGATGYLGIHVVKTLMDRGCEKIYCLVRHTKKQSSVKRMKMMFMYYFDDTFDSEIGKRIIPIDGDITDENIKKTLAEYDFDTAINCAACVKHFVNDDLLDRVNVQGVENLIDVCKTRDKKFVQISTVSVGGESVNGSVPKDRLLTENSLNIGQNLENKYAETKYRAEKAVLEAVREGLRGKIIRVGNLMSREKDGEFQINYSTNGFMKRLRAYAIMGSFPVGNMDLPAEFSPIDSTAQAIVLLAGTPDKFTVFHACNCHHVHMANVLEAMKACKIDIKVTDDNEFKDEFNKMLADEKRNMDISSLIAYLNNGSRRYVAHDNAFTVKALYRLGFSWHLTDMAYIRRAINALSTLGFFDYE
jgi:thioester reductase-like protein